MQLDLGIKWNFIGKVTTKIIASGSKYLISISYIHLNYSLALEIELIW